MKTKLPEAITTIEEAKALLTDLLNNEECYHPEDDAHDIIWKTCQEPTPEECDKLNKLMRDIYELPGDVNNNDILFDPCEFYLDFDRDVKYKAVESQFVRHTLWEAMVAHKFKYNDLGYIVEKNAGNGMYELSLYSKGDSTDAEDYGQIFEDNYATRKELQADLDLLSDTVGIWIESI